MLGAVLRLAVHLKGKNAKKYRKNTEYGFPASVFTAIPVNSGSSDYYGRSVPMQDIQALNHSQTFPLSRHFCLGYPRLALCLGKCGLSDSAFVSLKQVLLLVAQVC